MTSTELQAREERAAAAMQRGIYQIDSPCPDLFTVGYTNKAGKPVRYEVSTASDTGCCTCPDFEKKGGPCKHQLMVKALLQEIARFEEMMDRVLDEIAAERDAAGPATLVYGRPHFWFLWLETRLAPAEIRKRLGDLAGKVKIEENLLPGYRFLNQSYPWKIRGRKQDLSESDKAEVYRRLEVK